MASVWLLFLWLFGFLVSFFIDLIHLRRCYNHFTACCSFWNALCVCVLCAHWNSIWLSLKYHFTLFGVTVLLDDQTKHQPYIYLCVRVYIQLTLISGWIVLDPFSTVFSSHSSLFFDVWIVCPHNLRRLLMSDGYLWLADWPTSWLTGCALGWTFVCLFGLNSQE